jgi:hypothetical protein
MLQLARPGGAEAASDDTQMQMATHPGKKHALGTAAVWSGMHGMARLSERAEHAASDQTPAQRCVVLVVRVR